MTREAFLDALPSYLGLALRSDRSLRTDDAGRLSVDYRWLGQDVYRVDWDPGEATRPWTVTELSRVGGSWWSFGTGPTPREAAEVLLTYTLRFPNRPDEGLAARLADRVPPARIVIPEGGPACGAFPALGMVAVILLTHDPVPIPEIPRSLVTGAEIPPDVIVRAGTCVDIHDDGRPMQRVPVRMHEWICPAIDAPAVVRALVDFGHRDGVLPLMVVVGPSFDEYSIRIRLTKGSTVVVRSGRSVGTTLPEETLREADRAVADGRLIVKEFA